ncbi:DUF2188 domain-containing protein [Brevibacillus humidisoli]|uniref:DUF2188 domain-containing protein n=1 Tax=Brevibacillus humidisoli TaxID=2895522 RepID=UPI001E5C53DD|nr:DUF2188 domain-containing protein [Brevibacillus humidisoli]UFJ40584.1 DUF2188 domain-containing protein [Brevibacillus humidisoli]
MTRKSLVHLAMEERGTVVVTALFFFLCLGGFCSLLLLVGQAGLVEMRAQQTADLVSKGARAAGKWTYTAEDGQRRTILFATKLEAIQHGAKIVRGAREEAAILLSRNRAGFPQSVKNLSAIHQKGERRYLYRQGIYHIVLQLESDWSLFWQSVSTGLHRVSQSGL